MFSIKNDNINIYFMKIISSIYNNSFLSYITNEKNKTDYIECWI